MGTGKVARPTGYRRRAWRQRIDAHYRRRRTLPWIL